MKIFSPLEHFEFQIFTFLYNEYYDFSINSGILYLLSLLLFLFLFYFILSKSKIISFSSTFVVEFTYDLLLSIFKQQVTSIRALRFFPFIFIFIFI